MTMAFQYYVTTRDRRCSICRSIMHDKRTCPHAHAFNKHTYDQGFQDGWKDAMKRIDSTRDEITQDIISNIFANIYREKTSA